MHDFSFHLGAVDSFALLGCYIALVGSCLLRDSLPVPSSRLRQPKNMGPIGCTETSINNYQTTLCKTPKERISPSFFLSQFYLPSFLVFLLYIFFFLAYGFLSFDFCLCVSLFNHFNEHIVLRLLNRKCPKVRSRCSNYYYFTLTLIAGRRKKIGRGKTKERSKQRCTARIKGRK